MRRWGAAVALTLLAATPAGVARAEPVAPQPGSPCAAEQTGALTWVPDDRVPLECNGVWQESTAAYPVSDRWLSYGPALKLYGEGRRVASVASGSWTGTPTNPASRCRAEQYAVVYGTPTVGPPLVSEGAVGQPLAVTIVPLLFTVSFSGECLWVKDAGNR
ncbi:hypothetical protein LV457_03400 [Mycobacterium sp. MYCO198283]|uniref:hypothetical protein n=1 Tax=Mycobacterium sp. MYCO198283 TaxID=2883505 RepID=UPI001E5D0EE1|nr:hypothetical protein [Mycobacterium sp. MYCO198283]MCG5431335.1 hypothetical protein [Mycobacterium sp. MYCO198283]